jgi:hypothetical protein
MIRWVIALVKWVWAGNGLIFTNKNVSPVPPSFEDCKAKWDDYSMNATIPRI